MTTTDARKRDFGAVPFSAADHASAAGTGAAVTYTTGYNRSRTGQHEVIQRIRYEDGAEAEFVILRGVTSAKAKAIALILNSPEE